MKPALPASAPPASSLPASTQPDSARPASAPRASARPATAIAVLAFLCALAAGACQEKDLGFTSDGVTTTYTGSACEGCVVVAESIAFLGHPHDTLAIGDSHFPAVDSRGRLYMPAYDRRSVLVFNPDGRYRETFGKPGQGPGEFDGINEIRVGRGDTLVVSGRTVSHIIAPDYSHLGQYRVERMGPGGLQESAMLPTGRLLRQSSAGSFIMADLLGNISAPTPLQGTDTTPCVDCERMFAESRTSGHFWTSSRAAYSAEEFDLSGALVRRIVRAVDWYPERREADTHGAFDPAVEMAKPQLLGVVHGEDDLLWTYVLRVEDVAALRGIDLNSDSVSARFMSLLVTDVEAIDLKNSRIVGAVRIRGPMAPMGGGLSVHLMPSEQSGFGWKIVRLSVKGSGSGG